MSRLAKTSGETPPGLVEPLKDLILVRLIDQADDFWLSQKDITSKKTAQEYNDFMTKVRGAVTNLEESGSRRNLRWIKHQGFPTPTFIEGLRREYQKLVADHGKPTDQFIEDVNFTFKTIVEDDDSSSFHSQPPLPAGQKLSVPPSQQKKKSIDLKKVYAVIGAFANAVSENDLSPAELGSVLKRIAQQHQPAVLPVKGGPQAKSAVASGKAGKTKDPTLQKLEKDRDVALAKLQAEEARRKVKKLPEDDPIFRDFQKTVDAIKNFKAAKRQTAAEESYPPENTHGFMP